MMTMLSWSCCPILESILTVQARWVIQFMNWLNCFNTFVYCCINVSDAVRKLAVKEFLRNCSNFFSSLKINFKCFILHVKHKQFIWTQVSLYDKIKTHEVYIFSLHIIGRNHESVGFGSWSFQNHLCQSMQTELLHQICCQEECGDDDFWQWGWVA